MGFPSESGLGACLLRACADASLPAGGAAGGCAAVGLTAAPQVSARASGQSRALRCVQPEPLLPWQRSHPNILLTPN